MENKAEEGSSEELLDLPEAITPIVRKGQEVGVQVRVLADEAGIFFGKDGISVFFPKTEEGQEMSELASLNSSVVTAIALKLADPSWVIGLLSEMQQSMEEANASEDTSETPG